MNSVLYHQKIKQTEKNNTNYIGEDAYPYADDDFLIVADGLGGRGGFPHKSIDKSILDREKFYDICFSDVFENEVTDEYKEFVLKSFNELFEIKDYYFDDDAATKCSGYFASRFVTAIALYELKFGKGFDKETLFERVRSAKDEERDQVVQKIGDELATQIFSRLDAIALNAGLVLETKMSGAYLLPSTLVVTIMDETENGVDAIYLWAGDSRAYVWDKDGLGQITEDHEIDEVMTNLITLTKPFKIEGRYESFTKPCILLNASDGCYKCPMFASPFDLEYIINDAIVHSNDFDGAMNKLSGVFSRYGRHDDSNTMALTTFGYESYEEIKKATEERMTYIDENIVARLPDILERDYTSEVRTVQEGMTVAIGSIQRDAINCPGVIDFVKNEIITKQYPAYIKEVNELDLGDITTSSEPKEYEELRSWIKSHWLHWPSVRSYTCAIKKSSEKNDFAREYKKIYGEMRALDVKYRRMYAEGLSGAQAAFNVITDKLRTVIGVKKPVESNANEADEGKILAGIAKIENLLGLIKGVMSSENGYCEELAELKAKSEEYNNSCAESELEYVDEAMELLLNDEMYVKSIFGLLGHREEQNIPQSYLTVCELIKNCDGAEVDVEDEKQKIFDEVASKYVRKYWMFNGNGLIFTIWNEHNELLSQELRDKVNAQISTLIEKKEEVMKGFNIREQIYGDYDKIYRRKYRGSKI